MAQIPFSLRELKQAWRSLYAASTKLPRGNAHRLLLFYAIECGLKAVCIKRENRNLYNGEDSSGKSIGGKSGHDLRAIITQLHLGVSLSPIFHLSAVKDDRQNLIFRNGNTNDTLHQAWRYGGQLLSPPTDDAAMEAQLETIHRLIEKELVP